MITIKERLSNLLLYNGLFFHFFLFLRKVKLFFINTRFSDEKYLKRTFQKYQDYELNLENPRTLNEKLQWLKIHDRKDYHAKLADKYAARDFIEQEFGKEFLIPLVFQSTDYRSIIPGNFPDFPFVLKTNHGFGNSKIIRDKNTEDWKKVQIDFRRWLSYNYYYPEREWQYKDIKPRIIAEKLLLNNEGKIPNDYKLNFINGKLEFVYVSVDREGYNKRNIYGPGWEPLAFTWARKGKDLSILRGPEIDPPSNFGKMVEFGAVPAKLYKYVRVDFYDVDGNLYFGEITQCHGGGFDRMLPFEYDLMYGQKILLNT